MPPKRKARAARQEATDSEGDIPQRKRPCPRPKKNGPYKMPPPLPAGEVLTDICKRSWVLGDSVGKGGFGEIYRAAPAGHSASAQNADHVIKIEPQENGPLFTELAFYCRAAKPEMIDSWVSAHKLPYLAIPKYISQGMHNHGGLSFRFLVMQCFGEDIEKKFKQLERPFGIKTVCHLALRLLEALQFLHSSGYAHGDIKGSNLLTGRHPAHQHEVYLVDYGLAYRFCPDGKHKEYKEDPRRKHDGTLEFASIDAHKGVTPAPRGDLEILGYCLLQWAAGGLPWEDSLDNKDKVAQQKMRHKSDVVGLMKTCFTSSSAPKCLKDYMSYVYSLDYQQTPDYDRMQQMFLKELSSHGLKDDGKNLDWIVSGKKRKLGADEPDDSSPPKRAKAAPASSGKQKSKASSSAPKRGRSSAKATTKRKTKPLLPPPEATVAVANNERHTNSSSDGVPTLLPHVSYPPELGYLDSVEGGQAARGSRATKRPLPAKKRSPKRLQRSKRVSPAKRSPRMVRQRKQQIDLKKVLENESEEEWSPD